MKINFSIDADVPIGKHCNGCDHLALGQVDGSYLVCALFPFKKDILKIKEGKVHKHIQCLKACERSEQ